MTERSAPSSSRRTGDGTSITGYRGFFFCDLRGYTRFVERHGDEAAADLLDRYRVIVRDAVARFDGAEIRTEGDSFYVVFESASRAVLCGLAVVAGAREAAADGLAPAIPVAVGVHAGEAVERAEGFVGQAVNIAARVCAQAQAGEVLVTDTVRSLTRTTIAARFDPRGRRQLKGLDEPMFLFAAVGPGAAVAPVRRRPGLRTARAGLGLIGVAVAAGAVALAAMAIAGRPGSQPTAAPASAAAAGGAPLPDVGQIAYTDTRTATVWLIGEDGSDRRRVEANGAVSSAQISLDGRQLVYAWTEPGGGPGRIEIVGLGDGAPSVVTGDRAFDDRSPAWAPDHLAVVFSRASGAGEPAGLWAANFDGTQTVQLTAPASTSHEMPSWSPDGTRIAFSVAGEGIAGIGSDCSGLRSLGGVSSEDRAPVWSPDASRIAFTGQLDVEGPPDVFVMNAAGRNAVNVTAHAGVDRDPAWSPDGGRIVFVSDRSGDEEIWIANADGASPRQLTDRTGHAFGRLSWSLPPDEAVGGAPAPSAVGMVPPAVNRPVGESCPARAP